MLKEAITLPSFLMGYSVQIMKTSPGTVLHSMSYLCVVVIVSRDSYVKVTPLR